MLENFKDVDTNEIPHNRFSESPLGRQLETFDAQDIPETEADRPLGVITEVDEDKTKSDDNGKVYCIDKKILPNNTYELNGNIYATDDKGRIISCDAKPVRVPDNPRDIKAQQDVGGEDREPNDQGGHIVGRDLNGDGGIGNLLAMDSKINQSDYKRMENDIKVALDGGKDVTMYTEVTYDGNSERPDNITVTTTANGEKSVYRFDNNLDGSLMDEVPENGKEAVRAELDDTDGQISSIQETYDAKGNLIKTIVNITYADDDGSNHRSRVVIENS